MGITVAKILTKAILRQYKNIYEASGYIHIMKHAEKKNNGADPYGLGVFLCRTVGHGIIMIYVSLTAKSYKGIILEKR